MDYLIAATWLLSLVLVFAAGWFMAARRVAHILAACSPDELDVLAERVASIRSGGDK